MSDINLSSSSDTTNEDDIHKQVRLRVRCLRKYYTSLFSFIVINIFLYIINFVTTGKITWAYWVTFGWGIGMILYTFQMFFLGGKFWDEWERKQIEKIIDSKP